ncbi:hypothetical protein M569_01778, partial [Genlisea aurea]
MERVRDGHHEEREDRRERPNEREDCRRQRRDPHFAHDAAPHRTIGSYRRPVGRRTRPIALAEEDLMFEVKPQYLNMVKASTFGDYASEDPEEHLKEFVEICDVIKDVRTSDDAIRLRLFPFSLVGSAKKWFENLPDNSIRTWTDMEELFLEKFFEVNKFSNTRYELTTFEQEEGESIALAWERFKDIERITDNHGLNSWAVILCFHDGLNYRSKSMLDAAIGPMDEKSPNEAWHDIEMFTRRQTKWSRSRNPANYTRVKAVYEQPTEEPINYVNYNNAQWWRPPAQQLQQPPQFQNQWRPPAQAPPGNQQYPVQPRKSEFEVNVTQFMSDMQASMGKLSATVHQLGADVQDLKNIGKLPSQPLKIPVDCKKIVVINQPEELILHDVPLQAEEPHAQARAEQHQEKRCAEPPAYDPVIPFPQRLIRAKLDKEFSKFADMLKNLYVSLPFSDVIKQMPVYAKFLKDILANRRS